MGAKKQLKKSRRRRVYHQFRKELHITKAERFVYHQAAGRCTLMRDEMQRRKAAFDDIPTCVG